MPIWQFKVTTKVSLKISNFSHKYFQPLLKFSAESERPKFLLLQLLDSHLISNFALSVAITLIDE